MNELREALDDSVKGEDFARAAEIKEQIAELEKKSDNINLANQAQNQTVRIEKVRNGSWTTLGLFLPKSSDICKSLYLKYWMYTNYMVVVMAIERLPDASNYDS